MKTHPRMLGLCGLAWWLLCSCLTPPQPIVVEAGRAGMQVETPLERPAPWIIAAWYPAWAAYARSFPLGAIQADSLTHLFYAFAGLAEDGSVIEGDPVVDTLKVFGPAPSELAYHGNFAQIPGLRLRFPGLRCIITIGGSGLGPRFAAIAADPVLRQRMVASAISFIERYGFDGLDLDWEFPQAGDRANLLLLVSELREALGTRWLSLAAGASAARLACLDLAALGSHLDALNLMVYDFHGPWETQTGHHAALYPDPADPALRTGWAASRYNARDAVQMVLQQGFPPEKLVLACPAYGRAWYVAGTADVSPVALDGRFQPSAEKKPSGTWQTGSYDFDDLADPVRWPASGRHFDPASGASWYFDPESSLFVSYDDEASIAAKAGFVREWGLAGMIFWQLSADRGAVLPRTAGAILRVEKMPYATGEKGAIMQSPGGADEPGQF